MKKMVPSILGAAFTVLCLSTAANAQATRTWVSGVGDDANPCSRTAPCKTFAGAISKTATNGEINCLDPGGFGAVTITKAITISCEAGTAGVLVSGTNAIIVNAPASAFVTLRGLDFEGVGTGLSGIRVLSGAMTSIQNCTIRNFRGAATNAGIQIAPGVGVTVNVSVSDCVITGNAIGISVQPTGGVARLRAVRVQADANSNGIKANGNNTGGISVQVIDSQAMANGVSGFEATGGATTFMNVSGSSASGNAGTGMLASLGAVMQVGTSMAIGNATGMNGVQSYRTNQVNGNGTDLTGVAAVAGGFAAQAGLN